MKKLKVGIFGASGYVGGELIQRLSVHKEVEIVFLGALSNAGNYICHVFPHLRNGFGLGTRKFESLDEFSGCDLLISALPQGELPKRAKSIAGKVEHIINIAGDYRVSDSILLQKYYPDSLLENGISSSYIVPEFTTSFNTKILNLPGCMAVAALYCLMPLVYGKNIRDNIIVDAKTGSSGGGNKKSGSHAEKCGGIFVHKLQKHRHGAEIKEFVSKILNAPVSVHMTTTSVDIPRGVLVHVHGALSGIKSENELRKIYTQFYKKHPFIRFVHIHGIPHGFPSTKSVLGTNYCEVSCVMDSLTNQFTAVAALDNLVKGAAGNAIQLLNQLYHFPIEYGLEGFGVWP